MDFQNYEADKGRRSKLVESAMKDDNPRIRGILETLWVLLERAMYEQVDEIHTAAKENSRSRSKDVGRLGSRPVSVRSVSVVVEDAGQASAAVGRAKAANVAAAKWRKGTRGSEAV